MRWSLYGARRCCFHVYDLPASKISSVNFSPRVLLVRQFLLLVLLTVLGVSQQSGDKWQQWRAIKAAAFADEPRDPIEAQAVAEEIRETIKRENAAEAPAIIAAELIDFTVGLTWLHAGEFAKARAGFLAEVDLQRALGRSLYGNAGSPDVLMLDVMGFQAVLNAHKVSTAGLDLGYESWPIDVDGDGVNETLFHQSTTSREEGQYVVGKFDPGQEQRDRYFLFRESDPGRAVLMDQCQVISFRNDASSTLGRRGGSAVVHVGGVNRIVGYQGTHHDIPFVYPSPTSTLVLEVTSKGILGIPGPNEGIAEASATVKYRPPATSRADTTASALRAVKEPVFPTSQPAPRKRSYWSIFFPLFFVGTLVVAVLLLKRAHAHA